MEIRVTEEQGRSHLEVTILCAPGDARVPRIVRHIRAASGTIVGYEEPGSPERRVINLDELAYLETSGSHSLLHLTDGNVLESPMRLYELEGALEGYEFVRISRQEIVNFDHVRKVRPEANGRLVLDLDGGARVLVTRSYSASIKRILGIAR
jgi:hypothetical protein